MRGVCDITKGQRCQSQVSDNTSRLVPPSETDTKSILATGSKQKAKFVSFFSCLLLQGRTGNIDLENRYQYIEYRSIDIEYR